MESMTTRLSAESRLDPSHAAFLHEPSSRAHAQRGVLDGRAPGIESPLPRVVSGRPDFLHSLAGHLSGQYRDRGPVAIMSIDVGRLAHIKAAFGPQVVPRIGRAVVQRLLANAHDAEVISNLGGDNFAVAVRVQDASAGMARAWQLHEMLEAPLRLDDGTTVRLGVNLGMALAANHGATADIVLGRADLALGQSRARGAEECQMYTEKARAGRSPREVQQLLVELHHAADLGQLSLVFQPKLDLRSRRYAGAEVLVRWNSPVFGAVSPGEFIPIAEDAGLIRSIGKWVLREAVRSIATCQSRAGSGCRLAVNVSAAQLASETFVSWLEHLLDAEGVSGSCLELEITESALMASTHVAATRLSQLRALGVSITLDDFGTGYSTFSHLRQLPIDAIKIAPDFIADVNAAAGSGRLVAAMVTMARALDLNVVAEGIETDVQAAFLTRLGCDVGQGYLFARPMDNTALEAWLRTPGRLAGTAI